MSTVVYFWSKVRGPCPQSEVELGVLGLLLKESEEIHSLYLFI